MIPPGTTGQLRPEAAATDEQGADARSAAWEGVVNRLHALYPTMTIRIHSNRRVLLGLARSRGTWHLGVHRDFADHADALAELPTWIAQGGRPAASPAIDAAVFTISRDQQARRAAAILADHRDELSGLAVLGGPLDLEAVYASVHRRWFPHLSRPDIAWARARHQANRWSIRFACYHRGPDIRISVHPRLDQPWVALVFVEHVLFHELCHHAQACAPIRGEAVHSRRFRSWESAYPHHGIARLWEKVHLDQILAGSSPNPGPRPDLIPRDGGDRWKSLA